eukprot:COSAG06_NODE_1142_length_10545_cov_2.879571_9_plen_55_part_00
MFRLGAPPVRIGMIAQRGIDGGAPARIAAREVATEVATEREVVYCVKIHYCVLK